MFPLTPVLSVVLFWTWMAHARRVPFFFAARDQPVPFHAVFGQPIALQQCAVQVKRKGRWIVGYGHRARSSASKFSSTAGATNDQRFFPVTQVPAIQAAFRSFAASLVAAGSADCDVTDCG